MEEIRQIEKEYSSEHFFKTFEVVKINDEDSIIANENYILVTTLESAVHEIHVSINGWYGIDTTKQARSKLYPTFEGVAKELSPQFAIRWSESLIAKLNSIDDLEAAEDSSS